MYPESVAEDFVIFSNSADPSEMPHNNVAFHLGLHWLTTYTFLGFLCNLQRVTWILKRQAWAVIDSHQGLPALGDNI